MTEDEVIEEARREAWEADQRLVWWILGREDMYRGIEESEDEDAE